MNDMIAEKVRKMKSGDEAAFDWLYLEYGPKLYRMAFLITGNRSDSEDILQETFINCFLKRNALRDETAFEAWLYQILVRTAWRCRKRNRNDYSLDELTDKETESDIQQWIQADTEAVQPLEQVLAEEQRKQIFRAVQKLNMAQRTVIILYYYNDCSVEEIARITGSFAGTVKSRLFQARKNLRKMLERQGETDSKSERRKKV